ncbi:MAG: hypothetical protein HQK50_12720 [Oligoflexia bacterium]|nr:hypothetical protein [Oligoflexia bacterium]MBF0366427.1 hypothetical protein [Oligoflexia bacterium]
MKNSFSLLITIGILSSLGLFCLLATINSSHGAASRSPAIENSLKLELKHTAFDTPVKYTGGINFQSNSLIDYRNHIRPSTPPTMLSTLFPYLSYAFALIAFILLPITIRHLILHGPKNRQISSIYWPQKQPTPLQPSTTSTPPQKKFGTNK